MIPFRNKKQINEWMVSLENHVTLAKARILCEQRQCTIVEKSTRGFEHKSKAKESLESIRNCASMIIKYLEDSNQ